MGGDGEEKKERKMVNPDLRKGDAKAQWSDADLKFADTKGQMVGSQGQIIDLAGGQDPASAGSQSQNKVFKAVPTTTEQKEGTHPYLSFLASEYTMYSFQISFGKTKWDIKKRYSDFDKLDNRLNDKYGLPPIGLPQKKWFGNTDAELISERHKHFCAYINDCVKRPVLIHSRELQLFVEMPPEVVEMVTKKG